MEDKYLKELNIDAMEILDDTPIEDIVEYYFKLLVNANIKKLNNKIDQKSKKGDIKDAELEVANFTAAVKLYEFELENKKLLDGEIIEEYLTKLRNKSSEFNNLDVEWSSIINQEAEISESEKEIEDKIKDTGADVKALKKVVKQFVEDLNPNKKEPKRDIVLEGTVESYDKILAETKRAVFKHSKDIE